MKKVILSIIGILALIGAYSVLHGESKVSPTTARIDISEKTSNSQPCFVVKNQENGKLFPTADWMAKWGSQGYVVSKDGVAQELEIMVNSDKCKINFALCGPWELKDKNDSKKGIKELWVEYTKFAINGQDILLSPKPAWHNKPIYHSITAQKGNVFNIKINWQKYYTPEQLQIKNRATNILTIYLLFWGVIIFFLYKYRRKIYATQIWKKLAKLQDFDLEGIITQKWQAISPISKKSFLWIFLITNIVFLFHTVQYMWGNHDWILLKNGMPLYEMLWCGRFTGGLIQQVFGGDLLPVINNIFCFTGFTFAMIYLAKYWKVPQTPLNYTLFGLFIILMPYTLSWLWYIKQTSLYWNVFFVIYALYISQRKTYTSSVIAIILMVISLGAYASIISTIAIVLLGRILMDIILEQKSIKELFHAYLRVGINIVISVIIFKLILLYYDHAGKLKHGDYNTDYISIEDLPQKLKQVLRICVEIFYISQPYISTPYKIIISLPILCVLYRIIKNRPLQTILGLILIFAIILSSQITNLMAKADFSHKMRIDFFSLPYVWGLFIVICLRGKKGIQSLSIIIMSIALWMNILSDIRYQKVHYLGFKAEIQTYTDIITRIKQNKDFDTKRKYILITTMNYAKRNIFYKYNSIDKNDTAVLSFSFILAGDEKSFYDFLEVDSYIKNNLCLNSLSHINNLSLPELKHIAEFVLNKAQPYPHKNSVYVDDKYIFVIYDEEGLNSAKRNIQARLNELENKHE